MTVITNYIIKIIINITININSLWVSGPPQPTSFFYVVFLLFSYHHRHRSSCHWRSAIGDRSDGEKEEEVISVDVLEVSRRS